MDIKNCRWKVDTEKKLIIATLPVVVNGMKVDLKVDASTELETPVAQVIEHMTNHLLSQSVESIQAQMVKDGIPAINCKPNRAERRKGKHLKVVK